LSSSGDQSAGNAERVRRPSRLPRLVAVAALVCVAAVAIGSASRPHSIDLELAPVDPGDLALLVSLALAAAIGYLVATGIGPLLVRDPNRLVKIPSGSRVPRALRILMILVPLMVIAFFAAAPGLLRHGLGQTSDRPSVTPVVPPTGTETATGGTYLAAWIAIALTAGLLGVLMARRHRTVPVALPEPPESRAVILDEGLGALLAEADPRRAVIAAYVAMERAMARQGWARRVYEAPKEYLARVLDVAPERAGDLDRLVRLYEVARFSEHEVTAPMRDVAVAAVRGLRADLGERA
jgi:hypothetical protein